MVVRSEGDENRVHLSEINVLIFESTAISLTAYLINELLINNVKVIFCTQNHNPFAELVPYSGSHNQVASLREQLGWNENIKGKVWQMIVKHKIINQASNLKLAGLKDDADMLIRFSKEVKIHDETNREGHSAKVYFNRIFYQGFIRHSDDTINHALDYGYAVLLSLINREIVVNGYLTQLGIHHDSQFNHFNLGCDLMEPFRPVVDRYVLKANFKKFDSEEKHHLVQFLSVKVKYKNANLYLTNAIENYVRDIFNALNCGFDTESYKRLENFEILPFDYEKEG